MRFTDERRIIAAIKRKQNDSLDSEENSNKSVETPNAKQYFNNTHNNKIKKCATEDMHYLQKEKKKVLDKITKKRITNSNLFLKVALQKNDEEILLQIRGKDLVAIEVCYHSSCYKKYTRFLTRPASTIQKDENQNSFLKFCKDAIEKRIIVENQILRMNDVTRLFIKTVFEEENLELNYTNGNLKRRLKMRYPQFRFVKRAKRTQCELVLHETPHAYVARSLDSVSCTSTDSDSSIPDVSNKFSVSDNEVFQTLYSSSLTLKSYIDSSLIRMFIVPSATDLTIEVVESLVPSTLFNFLVWTQVAQDIVLYHKIRKSNIVQYFSQY
ncbi:hypothetical protein AVEN_125385-1 [Araneus ventricosus]|uniref:Uncharacterized protein n=1 Tax=Araneus ventricosus TaxID=182803 RepID=A0A4Y2U9R7_ARAVE|nr:hypothetical protein AVEN_125385-1 [Araneus ventricosus]